VPPALQTTRLRRRKDDAAQARFHALLLNERAACCSACVDADSHNGVYVACASFAAVYFALTSGALLPCTSAASRACATAVRYLFLPTSTRRVDDSAVSLHHRYSSAFAAAGEPARAVLWRLRAHALSAVTANSRFSITETKNVSACYLGSGRLLHVAALCRWMLVCVSSL